MWLKDRQMSLFYPWTINGVISWEPGAPPYWQEPAQPVNDDIEEIPAIVAISENK
jgi:hypothetical protein